MSASATRPESRRSVSRPPSTPASSAARSTTKVAPAGALGREAEVEVERAEHPPRRCRVEAGGRPAREVEPVDGEPHAERGARPVAQHAGAGEAEGLEARGEFRDARLRFLQHQAEPPLAAAEQRGVEILNRKAEGRERRAKVGAGEARPDLEPPAGGGAGEVQLRLAGQQHRDVGEGEPPLLQEGGAAQPAERLAAEGRGLRREVDRHRPGPRRARAERRHPAIEVEARSDQR
jgi:hypothetical protein